MKFSAYEIKIVRRLGAENHVLDALSRAFENSTNAMADSQTNDAWYLNQRCQVLRDADCFSDWKIENNRLQVHWPSPLIDPPVQDVGAWKLVIPKELRPTILIQVHDSPHSGHFGRTKTLDLARRYYFWLGMRFVVIQYVRKCDNCQEVKLP